MKKITIIALAFLIFASSAAALTFDSIADLQKCLLTHSPDQLMSMGTHCVELTGTVLEIVWTGQSNHWEMTLQLPGEPGAASPIYADSPLLRVHFRLHLDAVPFAVGDVLTVRGSLNEMYSAPLLPWILADTINGSGDF